MVVVGGAPKEGKIGMIGAEGLNEIQVEERVKGSNMGKDS